MDRFKFRVWDIRQQKYRKRTHHEADTCLNCLSGKVLYGEGIEIYGEEDDKDIVLEQCTGLKDKNGKLIYEGDIVRVLEQYKTNTTEQLYPMMFNEKVAKFGFKHPDGHFFYFTNDDNFSYEVIGNIHENADLLGEE